MLHVKSENSHLPVSQKAADSKFKIDTYLDSKDELKQLLELISETHRKITQEFTYTARLEAFNTRNLIRMIKSQLKLGMTREHFARIAALAVEGMRNEKFSSKINDGQRQRDASFNE